MMIDKAPLYALLDQRTGAAALAARRERCDPDEFQTLASLLTEEAAGLAAGDLALQAELFLRAGGTFGIWEWFRFERGERLAFVIARERIARGEVHPEITEALDACVATKTAADAEADEEHGRGEAEVEEFDTGAKAHEKGARSKELVP